MVRQLGRPNLLAATYSSNAAAAATAAMEELEESLLGSLQELQRISSGVGEPWAVLCVQWGRGMPMPASGCALGVLFGCAN